MSAVSPTPSSLIPGADQYAQAETLANNAYNNALALLNQNRLNTLTNYGYTGTVDPTNGVLGDIHVDTHAIHGQLQDLLHNQAIEDMQARFGSQDRGLFGGLGNQASSELHWQHGSQDTALGSGLQQQLSDFQSQQQQDAETRDNALWQAENAALNAQLQNQTSDSTDQLLQGGYDDSGSSGSTGGSSTDGGSGGGTQGGGNKDKLDPGIANALKNRKGNKSTFAKAAKSGALKKVIASIHGTTIPTKRKVVSTKKAKAE